MRTTVDGRVLSYENFSMCVRRRPMLRIQIGSRDFRLSIWNRLRDDFSVPHRNNERNVVWKGQKYKCLLACFAETRLKNFLDKNKTPLYK